jgi:hypothetical protein
MRDFFIKSLEMVINVVVVVAAIGIVVAAAAMLFGGTQVQQATGMPGVLGALLVLIGGGLYLIVVAGFMYMGLGIYQNTKRTAELLAEGRR